MNELEPGYERYKLIKDIFYLPFIHHLPFIWIDYFNTFVTDIKFVFIINLHRYTVLEFKKVVRLT